MTTTPMEISGRAAQLTPSLTLSIDAKAKAMKAEGIDVCGFGAGEPDFDTPEHIKQAAISALQSGFTKYTPSSGIPELRQAIAEKLAADNGLNYKPTQVVVSNGAKHACYNAILATCQPGDEVIIPAPYWVSYPDMVKLAGAEAVIIPTSERNGWKIRAEDFENAMTGWRLGYLAAPEAVAKAVDSIQSHSTANPCSFAQRGALAALKGDQQPIADMRDEFDMRRNYMFDRISKIPNVTAVKPQGA